MGKKRGKTKRTADEMSSAGDSSPAGMTGTATDHVKTKPAKKSKTVAPSGESSCNANAIDDAINSVLSQNMNASTVDCGDDGADAGTVDQLVKKVKDQQRTIDRLTQQVGFLLSYLGLEDKQVAAAAATAATGRPTAFAPTAGTSSSSSGAAISSPATMSYAAVSAGRPVPLSAALKQAVVSAVYRDFEDKERRNRNVVVSGLPIGAVSDAIAVMDLLSREFGRDFNIAKCRRLGRQQNGKIQPLLVTLDSEMHASHVSQNARLLRQSSDELVRKSVYINPDLTKAEAFTAYQNRCDRRQRQVTQRTRPPPRIASTALSVPSPQTVPPPSSAQTLSDASLPAPASSPSSQQLGPPTNVSAPAPDADAMDVADSSSHQSTAAVSAPGAINAAVAGVAAVSVATGNAGSVVSGATGSVATDQSD